MGSSSNKRKPPRYTVYFDGYCNLCNAWVDRILRNEKRARFYFAPLSGTHARSELPEQLRGDGRKPEAIVLQERKSGEIWTGGKAVLRILQHLKWPYRILALGKILPKSLTEKIYSKVAKNRYRWYGKRESCRLPSPDEAERFLD